MHVRANLEEDLVRVVRRRDALPSTGTQRGKPLRARGSLADHQENWRAAGDARIGPERAAQLNARHVGHLGVHKDHVWLGGARALEGMLTRALLEDGVPATLQQAPEPAGCFLAVARQEHEW